MSKAADSRFAVLEALRAAERQELSESAISRVTGIKGMWLSHALIGLQREGLIRLRALPGYDTAGRRVFFWTLEGHPVRPVRPLERTE